MINLALARLGQTSHCSVMLALLLGMLLGQSVRAQSGCCLALPAAPNNAVTVNVRDRTPATPSLLLATVLNGGAPLPVNQDYLAWCIDWETFIDLDPAGTTFSGQVYSSCDPNLSGYLPNHTNSQGQVVDKVDAATWKKVNYLLNHHAGYYYFDVQVALLHYVGGPYVVFPGDPPTDSSAVDAMVNAAEANAAGWQPKPGDMMAAILNFEPNYNPLEPDVQLLLIEVPFIDTTPPEIVCPADQAATSATTDGTPVFFNPSATDTCDMNPMIVCLPPSGSTFVVGEHLVLCSATDASGNSNACSFTVKVVPKTVVAASAADSGPGTLRQALVDALAAPGSHTIVFDFPGPPPYIIQLLSPLPELTGPVVLDGWSQPSFSGTPVIELDGSAAAGPGGAIDGLVVSGGDSTVRGFILSGFAVAIRLQSVHNVIQGNVIGSSPSGGAPLALLGAGPSLGNGSDGIYVDSGGNVIGGAVPAARNIISGNQGNGVHLDTDKAIGNLVQGNYIGTGSDGVTPQGNAKNGVALTAGAAQNVIGGTAPGEGNLIAFNLLSGVLLDATAGAGNLIRGNSILSNGGIGIDLGGDGVTPNHSGVDGTGPNHYQNYPVFTAAHALGDGTIIDGTLNAAPRTVYQIDFFLNTAPGPAGSGGGQTFLGTTQVKTDSLGNRAFSVSFAVVDSADKFISATATDPGNNTSEFTPAFRVTGPPVIEVQPIGTNVDQGAEVTLCATVTGSEPIAYQWRHNGQNITDATNRCYTIPGSEVADGGSYTVVVGNSLGAVLSTEAPLVLQLPNLPAGDNFADRAVLAGASGTVEGSNVSATKEPGEPNHAGKPGGSSVWYSWTAPANGIATFQTAGSTFDSLLGIYTGSAVGSLTEVVNDEDGGRFFASLASFTAVAGTSYQVAIDGFGGATGTFVLNWQLEVTADVLPVIVAQPLSQTVAPGSNVTFNVVATYQPKSGDPTLAYQWFFDGTSIPGATASTLTILDVEAQTVGNYVVRVTGGTRTVASLPASLQINDTDGTVEAVEATDKFLDAVDSPNPLQLGNGPTGHVAGRARAAGSVVRGYTGTQVFNTAGSTTDAGEEPICAVLGGASQWLAFVAGESGFLFLNTDGSSYDTVMAVFMRSGTNTALVQLACDNNSGTNGKTSSLVVPVQAGQTNFIVVDGVGGATGVLHLNYSLATMIQLKALGLTPQGSYHLQLSGRPTQKFTIQRSATLINWTSLLTTNAPAGVLDFFDATPSAFSHYYRALLLP